MNINIDELNSFELIHTFDYYEFPLFYVSKSIDGNYYLIYYIEELENGEHSWLFSQISNMERLELINHRISVLGLLNNLKDSLRLNYLYMNPFDDMKGRVKLELIRSNNFDSESFPLKDYYVDYDFENERELSRVEDIELDASQFKVVLKDRQNQHDIGVEFFTSFLKQFKKTLNGIATDVVNRAMGESRGEYISLRIDSLQPSSFGIYLRTEKELFDTNNKALGTLFEMIENIDATTEDKILNLMGNSDYSISAIKNVNELLKEIKDNDYTFSLESKVDFDNSDVIVKFNRDSYSKIEILHNQLSSTKIESEEIDLEGVLTSINATVNRFTIEGEDFNITGYMTKELFLKVKDDVSKFMVPNQINAKIIKESLIDAFGQVRRTKYLLQSYKQTNETNKEQVELELDI